MEVISSDKLVIKTSEAGDFTDLADFQRLVRLQSKGAAILASVGRVEVDDHLQRIYIADFDSRALSAFSNDGNFIRPISRRGDGPGEYRDFTNFAVLPRGRVVVLSSTRIMILDRDDQQLKRIEVRSSADGFLPSDVVVHNDLIYVHVGLQMRGEGQVVHVYNDQLKLLRKFHPYDNRHNIYRYTKRRSMILQGDTLIHNPDYELGLFQYDLGSGAPKGRAYHFPTENSKKMQELWTDPNFNEETRTQIRANLHRFQGMYPLGDFTFLVEFRLKPSFIGRTMAIKGKQLVQFKDYHFFSHKRHAGRSLLLRNIVGSYRGMSIGVIEYDEYFDAVKGKYPWLKDVALSDLDNPLLVFFRSKL